MRAIESMLGLKPDRPDFLLFQGLGCRPGRCQKSFLMMGRTQPKSIRSSVEVESQRKGSDHDLSVGEVGPDGSDSEMTVSREADPAECVPSDAPRWLQRVNPSATRFTPLGKR